MRFVFLDIDGVLAPFKRVNEYTYTCHDILPPNGCLMFDPACVAELNYICEAAKASIIVSSSWRHYIRELELMRKMLRSQGVNAPISGMTPEAAESWPDHSRGAEVRAFLDSLDVEAFVILDDTDMGWNGLTDWWVKPDARVGLQSSDSKLAINILLQSPASEVKPGAVVSKRSQVAEAASQPGKTSAKVCNFVYELESAVSFVTDDCRLASPVEVVYELHAGEGVMRIEPLPERMLRCLQSLCVGRPGYDEAAWQEVERQLKAVGALQDKADKGMP